MFPRNVPKRSLQMFPECSHEKFYERSIQMLSDVIQLSFFTFMHDANLWTTVTNPKKYFLKIIDK